VVIARTALRDLPDAQPVAAYLWWAILPTEAVARSLAFLRTHIA
jgi:hypothetical protein